MVEYILQDTNLCSVAAVLDHRVVAVLIVEWFLSSIGKRATMFQYKLSQKPVFLLQKLFTLVTLCILYTEH